MISGLASIKVIDNFLSDKETSDLLAQLEAGESPRNEVWGLLQGRIVAVAGQVAPCSAFLAAIQKKAEVVLRHAS